MNILRRLPLSRLLLLCGAVVAIGVSATALASALGGGPTPKEEALAVAVHQALTAPPVEGVSANVQLTDHLLEGANLASGNGGEAGQLSASPLVSGASGRLWASKDGRVRLELQSEKGDTQIFYDGHTLQMYDASTNTLYRYKASEGTSGVAAARTRRARVAKRRAGGPRRGRLHHSPAATASGTDTGHEPPSVAKIEEAISHLQQHAHVSGAQPGDIAEQPAYSVRVSPNEGGSLFGGVELSWDAVHGVPLRAAVYSTTSSSAVLELAASKISYGPVESSVFDFKPPPDAKIEEVTISPAQHATQGASSARRAGKPRHAATAAAHQPKLTTRGKGPGTIAVIESRPAKGKKGSVPALPESLPQVKLNGVSATQLATPLGTLLSFERSGVRYLLAGSVTPSTLEAVARGL
jgi:outer membrane lipoprotein-sorting protein